MSEARQMQITSLDAYTKIRPELGERQLRVYNALLERGPMCNREISQVLRMPINSITPRVMELRIKELVRFMGFKHDPITNRNVIVWGVA